MIEALASAFTQAVCAKQPADHDDLTFAEWSNVFEAAKMTLARLDRSTESSSLTASETSSSLIWQVQVTPQKILMSGHVMGRSLQCLLQLDQTPAAICLSHVQ